MRKPTREQHETAIHLIACATAALHNGVVHTTEDGRELTSAREIVAEMSEGRPILLDETARVDRVRTEDLFERLKLEYPYVES